MKNKIKELIESYDISVELLGKRAGMKRTTLYRALYHFPESKLKLKTYEKIFESLYVIAKYRKRRAYNLEHDLDNLDEKLFFDMVKKYEQDSI